MNDKQAMTKEEIVELQTTWTAFGGLSKEEQEFLKEHKKYVYQVFDNGNGPMGCCDVLSISLLYRLSPAFQLPAPEPDWLWYNPNRHTVCDKDGVYFSDTDLSNPIGCIEIPADEVPYVKKCIELHRRGKVNLDEFEFRNIKEGVKETWIVPCTGLLHTGKLLDDTDSPLFVRKPAKEPSKFVEYPVFIHDRYTLGYRCVVSHIHNSEVPLHKLTSIVGFAGVKFRHDDGYETSWIEALNFIQADETPATPIAARFYVKESK